MGDQLAKGWADNKAQEPIWHDAKAQFVQQNSRGFFWMTALGADSLYPTSAEVQAEEDMLP